MVVQYGTSQIGIRLWNGSSIGSCSFITAINNVIQSDVEYSIYLEILDLQRKLC